MAEEQDEQQQQNMLDVALLLINEYTITYDLTSQAYFFTMGNQDFEVNADVLRNALSIKVLDHPFALPAPEKETIKFIKELGCPKPIKTISTLRGMVTGSNIDFAELIWEEFKYQIEPRKAGGSKPVMKGGKGLLSKKRVKIAVKRISIPKIRQSRTITEEFDQSKQIDDQGDSEETEKYEEPLIKRQTTGIIFSKEVRRYPYEERVDHSIKLKGLEALSEAAQLKVDLKKARKASKDNLSIDKRALLKREYDSKVNERQMQTTEEKDTSSSSLNDTDADDADIKPVYDEEPIAEFAKSSMLGKSVLQPHRNQSVVRQPTVFKSERPRISKPRFTSQVDVNNDLSKPVTTHYLPKGKEYACTKPHHMIAPGVSRYSSNDMVHNHYLEEAKKQTQEIGRTSKTSVMPYARSKSTTYGSKPKPRINEQTPRNWHASKTSWVTTKIVPITEHSRNSRKSTDSK
ncbi:hypothetical protein Tco_1095993, partial [Tanacetum coccineum]